MKRYINCVIQGVVPPFLVLLLALIAACSNTPSGTVKVNETPVYTYRIVAIYPHARSAFTQGLVFDKGELYEGTGLLGRSTLRKVDLETGHIIKLHWLPSEYFGEGITIFGDRIIQLTWKDKKGFVYDKEGFELRREFHYDSEGWGITHDGTHLIMSDGTSVLHILNPETFEEVDTINVTAQNGPVTGLNELEFIRGEVYANIWPTERIARISPQTGKVTGWIDMRGLLTQEDLRYPVDTLNGIAYDPDGERIFVTGKLWPKLFQIEICPPE